jgi:hypothetical protein
VTHHPGHAPDAGPERARADRRAERLLVDAAERADLDPVAAIRSIDYLAAQIAVDRRAGTFEDWARSTVLDEHTGGPVLAAGVLEALGRLAGLPVDHPHANAGLVHTYGYLLSPVPTPYGAKRARWTDGRLAVALGQAPDHFRPWLIPAGDSLLDRVTRAVLPIATGSTTKHLVYSRTDPDGAGGTLVTQVWRAPASPAAALVYAHLLDRRCRLVTTFPVAGTADQLAELAALPATPHYNVVVEPC